MGRAFFDWHDSQQSARGRKGWTRREESREIESRETAWAKGKEIESEKEGREKEEKLEKRGMGGAGGR
jgi:hypothetical protein